MEAVFFRLHERTIKTVIRIFPSKTRLLIEYTFLCGAVILLSSLVYLHMEHVNIEGQCLNKVLEHSKIVPNEIHVLRIHLEPNQDKLCFQQCPMSTDEHSAKYHFDDASEKGYTVSGKDSVLEGSNQYDPVKGDKSGFISFWTSHWSERANQMEENSSNSASKGWISVVDIINSGDSGSTRCERDSDNAECVPTKIYMFSMEKGLLMLRPEIKAQLGVITTDVYVPVSDNCMGNWISRMILEYVIGYDVAVVRWLNDLYNGKGFVYNVLTKELINLNQANEFMQRTKAWEQFLVVKIGIMFTTVFLFFTTTTLVSFTLRETQERMLRFTFLLQHHIRNRLPYAPLVFTHVVESLVFVPIMVGILFFLFEFFSDQLLAFMVLSVIWMCEVYSVMSVRTATSMRFFPRIVFFYFSLFHIYFFSFPFGYSYLALMTAILFLQHSMIYFWNRCEIPALLSRRVSIGQPRMEGVISVRAIPNIPTHLGMREITQQHDSIPTDNSISHDAVTIQPHNFVQLRNSLHQNIVPSNRRNEIPAAIHQPPMVSYESSRGERGFQDMPVRMSHSKIRRKVNRDQETRRGQCSNVLTTNVEEMEQSALLDFRNNFDSSSEDAFTDDENNRIVHNGLRNLRAQGFRGRFDTDFQ